MNIVKAVFSAWFAVSLVMIFSNLLWAMDYDRRFVREYPPGYYGMYYNALRFMPESDRSKPEVRSYDSDRSMSKLTGLTYPFVPIPYAWRYGQGRNFNLPDYNSNDWW